MCCMSVCVSACGGQCGPCWQGYSRVSSHFAPQEKEMEKQRLLYQQSRLHNRGAAEMVLQMISACKGSTHALAHVVVSRRRGIVTIPNERPALTYGVLAGHLAKQTPGMSSFR